jgi:hypothetical protein
MPAVEDDPIARMRAVLVVRRARLRRGNPGNSALVAAAVAGTRWSVCACKGAGNSKNSPNIEIQQRVMFGRSKKSLQFLDTIGGRIRQA